jgi:magnesium chelatase subunit I
MKKAKKDNPYAETINWFGNGNSVNLLDDISDVEYQKVLEGIPGLQQTVKLFYPNISANQTLLYMEFVLHGLAEFSLVSKGFLEKGFEFKDMFNSLFSSEFADDDDESGFDDRY